MKKNIANVFLSVALTIVSILLYNCITELFCPILTETKYTCTEYETQVTYVFHSNGNFETTIIQDGEKKVISGSYAVEGNEISLFYIHGRYGEPEKSTMTISYNKLSLIDGNIWFVSGSYMPALYTFLLWVAEIGLIITVIVLNKNTVKKENEDDK